MGPRHKALDRFPREFSGGQRRRMTIALALAAQLKLIVELCSREAVSERPQHGYNRTLFAAVPRLAFSATL